MTAWIAWRLVKLLAVTALAGGVLAAVGADTRARRTLAAHRVATPALIVAWSAGQPMMTLTERGFEPWILSGIATSLLAFHAAVVCAHAGRPRPVSASVAVGALMATVALMVLRPDPTPAAALPVLLAAALGPALVAALGPVAVDPAGDVDPASVWRWFRWLARLEGVSLVLLTVVSMPLKYGAGIALDGGTGWLGWVNGALFLVYLQGLASAARCLGWRPATVAGGLLAALLPFGAFAFEAMAPRPPAARGCAPVDGPGAVTPAGARSPTSP